MNCLNHLEGVARETEVLGSRFFDFLVNDMRDKKEKEKVAGLACLEDLLQVGLGIVQHLNCAVVSAGIIPVMWCASSHLFG